MINTILLVFLSITLLAILYVLKQGINEILTGLNTLFNQLRDIESRSDKSDTESEFHFTIDQQKRPPSEAFYNSKSFVFTAHAG